MGYTHMAAVTQCSYSGKVWQLLKKRNVQLPCDVAEAPLGILSPQAKVPYVPTKTCVSAHSSSCPDAPHQVSEGIWGAARPRNTAPK